MNGETSSKEKASKDAQIMKAIIRDMGIEDWEPQVIQQLLEYSYKYEYIALNTSNTATSMNTLNILVISE